MQVKIFKTVKYSATVEVSLQDYKILHGDDTELRNKVLDNTTNRAEATDLFTIDEIDYEMEE